MVFPATPIHPLFFNCYLVVYFQNCKFSSFKRLFVYLSTSLNIYLIIQPLAHLHSYDNLDCRLLGKFIVSSNLGHNYILMAVGGVNYLSGREYIFYPEEVCT